MCLGRRLEPMQREADGFGIVAVADCYAETNEWDVLSDEQELNILVSIKGQKRVPFRLKGVAKLFCTFLNTGQQCGFSEARDSTGQHSAPLHPGAEHVLSPTGSG